MEPIFKACAGLDVHKKRVTACARVWREGRLIKEVRTFGTMTEEILQMAAWLTNLGITHVAMESTGVFWKPIYNLLEGRFEVLLCNARHIKQVPGRKTDVKDCEWIAQLLECGLLKPSFIPPRHTRELRDLTRQRTQLVEEHTAVANRIHKVLEDANIKLGSVATDVLGVSGLAILRAMVRGEDDPTKLADLARSKLRAKIPQLRMALEGRMTEHHRYMLKLFLDQLAFLEGLIAQLTARIEQVMGRADTEEVDPTVLPFGEATRIAATVPGIDHRSACNIIAEIGTDMTRFPSASDLSSWAGVCPGNNESAGKKRAAAPRKGNRWLRRALGQAAAAASHSKRTYLGALYHRKAARRGKARANVAVQHSILVALYHMLSRRQDYVDLGPRHFDSLYPARTLKYLVRRLNALGMEVTLKPAAA